MRWSLFNDGDIAINKHWIICHHSLMIISFEWWMEEIMRSFTGMELISAQKYEFFAPRNCYLSYSFSINSNYIRQLFHFLLIAFPHLLPVIFVNRLRHQTRWLRSNCCNLPWTSFPFKCIKFSSRTFFSSSPLLNGKFHQFSYHYPHVTFTFFYSWSFLSEKKVNFCVDVTPGKKYRITSHYNKWHKNILMWTDEFNYLNFLWNTQISDCVRTKSL